MTNRGAQFLAVFLIFAAIIPQTAEARVFVGIGYGGYSGYGGYGGYPYYPYPSPYSYYPPPVVYAASPVVYAPAPSSVTYYAAPSALSANQTSPTFVDSFGRSCREYQAMNGLSGTACLQPDGTWRVVN